MKNNWEVLTIDIGDLKKTAIIDKVINKIICHVYLPEWKITQESEENAKLIAAAPELLEALNKIIEMNLKQALDKYGDSLKAESWSCVRVAREAIQKATGNE